MKKITLRAEIWCRCKGMEVRNSPAFVCNDNGTPSDQMRSLPAQWLASPGAPTNTLQFLKRSWAHTQISAQVLIWPPNGIIQTQAFITHMNRRAEPGHPCLRTHPPTKSKQSSKSTEQPPSDLHLYSSSRSVFIAIRVKRSFTGRGKFFYWYIYYNIIHYLASYNLLFSVYAH